VTFAKRRKELKRKRGEARRGEVEKKVKTKRTEIKLTIREVPAVGTFRTIFGSVVVVTTT
jgi:hypothetical protein